MFMQGFDYNTFFNFRKIAATMNPTLSDLVEMDHLCVWSG